MAPKMIIGVNGFAEKFGFFKNQLLVFAAHASLSRQLTADEQAAMGSVENWGLTPANAFAGITMRYTADHRILIRQDIHFKPDFRMTDAKRAEVRRTINGFSWNAFPCCRMSPWSTPGPASSACRAMTRRASARCAGNVYAAVCQNAVGVTKGTIGGILAADMAPARTIR